MQIARLSSQQEDMSQMLDSKTSRIKELEKRLLEILRELEAEKTKNEYLASFE